MYGKEENMSLKRRRFTRDFKLQILREVEGGKSIASVSREHEIHPNLIGKWQKVHGKYAEEAFGGNGHLYKEEAKIAQLERMVGRLAMENEFLKKVLARLEAEKERKR
jgi:transposase